jgi:ABC-type sugar transport system substrate-binding protein
MSRIKATLAAGLAALTFGSALLASVAAQAGETTGRWRDGSYATPYGIVRPYHGYGYRPHYRRGSDVGGAAAAGVIGCKARLLISHTSRWLLRRECL